MAGDQNNEKWSAGSLIIISGSLTPAEISNALVTQPTQAFERGSSLSPGNRQSGTRDAHVWILESGLDSSEPLEAHVTRLIEFLEAKQDKLKELVPSCQFQIFCGFSSEIGQGGFVLDAALLRRLTVLPLDLVLDLYPPSDPNAD